MVTENMLFEKKTLTFQRFTVTEKMFFAPIIVDAVMSLDEDLSLDMIGVKKVAGGTLEDSKLIKGVAFKKTFSYAGFEQQPKKFKDCKIVLLNVELELKSEKENAEIRLDDPNQVNPRPSNPEVYG